MKRRYRVSPTLTALALASSLVVSPAVPPPAEAGAPTDALREFFGAVNVVLADPRTESRPLEKLRAIRRHVDEVFDFREAAILAVGREWPARTLLEQNEFVVLFADLLERAFVWRVAGKAALGGGVKVHYVGETVDGDVATVDTAVAARDGNDLKLGYRMVRRAGRWVVRDVVMDGVSTMENYHAQFQRVVRDGSWRDLVRQLRAKVGAPAVHIVSTPPPRPGSRPSAILAGPPAPPALDRSMPEERAIARDVAAVVRPTLAVRDVPPPRQPAPPTPQRRVAPAPPPVGPLPATATPPPGPIAPTTALGSPGAHGAGGSLSSRTAVVPAAPAEPSRTPKPVVVRALETPPAFWIQVGAYRNPTTAGRVATRVGGEIMVAPARVAGDPLLRVRVGPFGNRAEAAARLRDLQKLGYQPFVAAE